MLKYMILYFVLFGILFSEESKLSKILIKKLEIESGISKEIESKISNGILYEIQSLEKEINYITEDSIIDLLKITSLNQKIGSSDKESLEKIERSLKFDGMISGKISSTGNQIVLSINKLVKDSEGDEYKTVDSFMITLFKFQISYYTKEISKRLLDPEYKINEEEAPLFSESSSILFDDSIKMDNLNLDSSKSKIQDFKLDSYTLGLESYLKKAEDDFHKDKYLPAVEVFNKIIDSTNNLSPVSKEKIKTTILFLEKRIKECYIQIYKDKLVSLDSKLNQKQEYSIEELKVIYGKYQKEFVNYTSLPTYAREEILESTFTKRMESIKFSELKLWKIKADEYSDSSDFNQAGDIYAKILIEVGGYFVLDKKQEFCKEVEEKKFLNYKRARTFIESNLNSYLNFAESENSRFILELNLGNLEEAKERKENAVSSLKYLRKLLTSSKFIYKVDKERFNDITDRINQYTKPNYTFYNVALLPFRYILNIGKGITDIFVIKVGEGLGAGAQALILGGDIVGEAEYPIEFATAYPDSESKLSGSDENFYLYPLDNKKKPNYFTTSGCIIFGKTNCISLFGVRFCEYQKYSTVNMWVGLGVSVYISLETHRIPELVGIIAGQDLDLFKTRIQRYKYFGYDEVDRIPLKSKFNF